MDDREAAEEDELVDAVSSLQLAAGGGAEAGKKASGKKTRPGRKGLPWVAERIRSGQAKNIIVMSGAGISVAAGIPDFRSPGTGLYYNLQKYRLPRPTAVFEIEYFHSHPEPFYMLARELWPGSYSPTRVHHFLRLLDHKGVLLRNFTQNIDALETVAGLDRERIVEAHGSFATARCVRCGDGADLEEVRGHVFRAAVPRCAKCGGTIKPDIVFFGENLPERYHARAAADFRECDLLIVLGTSLAVRPFAGLIESVPEDCPRVLINRESVGDCFFSFPNRHMDFHSSGTNDVLWLGDVQDGVSELCSLLGWADELDELVRSAAPPRPLHDDPSIDRNDRDSPEPSEEPAREPSLERSNE